MQVHCTTLCMTILLPYNAKYDRLNTPYIRIKFVEKSNEVIHTNTTVKKRNKF
jgi:hypothetical protein